MAVGTHQGVAGLAPRPFTLGEETGSHHKEFGQDGVWPSCYFGHNVVDMPLRLGLLGRLVLSSQRTENPNAAIELDHHASLLDIDADVVDFGVLLQKHWRGALARRQHRKRVLARRLSQAAHSGRERRRLLKRTMYSLGGSLLCAAVLVVVGEAATSEVSAGPLACAGIAFGPALCAVLMAVYPTDHKRIYVFGSFIGVLFALLGCMMSLLGESLLAAHSQGVDSATRDVWNATAPPRWVPTYTHGRSVSFFGSIPLWGSNPCYQTIGSSATYTRPTLAQSAPPCSSRPRSR